MFLILCAPPSFLGSGLLLPHHSTLWGCPERMPWGNEQQTLPWEAAFMPPLSPQSHCQESHSLLGMCKSSACSR